MTSIQSAPAGMTALVRRRVIALGLIGAIQNLDPAANSLAIVPARAALEMTSAQYALAASFGTLCLAASILAGGRGR